VYDLAPPDGVVVEVGCFLGRSTLYLARRCRLVHAVDTWCGSGGRDPRGDEEQRKAFRGDPYVAFCENVRAARLQDRVLAYRMPSVEAAALFSDGEVDFCFIDAAHDEASVAEDVRSWWPRVAPGGILAGHDYGCDWPGVDRAVDGFFGSRVRRVWRCWIVTKEK
jgi:hypothetical protein